MSLGLRHGENRVVPYSSDWPARFNAESVRIQNVCHPYLLAIEHIGSTSIPGLSSKPIIDMVVGVASLDHAVDMVAVMQSIGYDYPGDIGIPGDRIFGREREVRQFLVHVVVHDGKNWKDYLRFRDALRANAVLSAEYEALKLAIASKHPEGRGIYTELKSDFVQRALQGTQDSLQ